MAVKVYWLISLVFFSARSICQNIITDSLFSVLMKTGDDTNKVNTLNSIASEFRFGKDFITAKAYALQSINLSERINFYSGQAIAFKIIGNTYSDQGDNSNALVNYFSALKILEPAKQELSIASILTNIGNAYSQTGTDNDKAINYYYRAKKIFEDLHMQQTPFYFNDLIGIGTVCENQRDFDDALKYYFQAKDIGEQIKDYEGVGIALNNIGNICKENKKQYDIALNYYEQALTIRKDIADRFGIATTLCNMASVYYLQKKFKDALKYCAESLEISKSVDDLVGIRNAELLLSDIFEELGDKSKALIHYKEYTKAKDSLFNSDNIKKVTSQEFKLKEEKMSSDFAVESQRQKDELKQQKTIRYAFTAGFSLVLILVAVILRSLKQSRKKNKIIEMQKMKMGEAYEKLHDKNKEVMDSIRYAKRIQTARLTSEKYISRKLNDLRK